MLYPQIKPTCVILVYEKLLNLLNIKVACHVDVNNWKQGSKMPNWENNFTSDDKMTIIFWFSKNILYRGSILIFINTTLFKN